MDKGPFDIFGNDDDYEIIHKVSRKFASCFIDAWCNWNEDRKNPKPIKTRLLTQNKNGTWTAIDNLTGDCWCEDFKSRKGALDYLNGKDPEECQGYIM